MRYLFPLWLIPTLPLAGFLLNGLLGRRLPKTIVTLAAGTARSLPFTVTVPNHVPAKQYLAGITVEPNTTPAPVVVGSNGQASAQAVVIDQVSVGVAVTVGALAQLKTSLQIPAVTGGADGPIPRIYVQVHNVGQTFTKAHGTARCVVKGATVSMAVSITAFR